MAGSFQGIQDGVRLNWFAKEKKFAFGSSVELIMRYIRNYFYLFA